MTYPHVWVQGLHGAGPTPRDRREGLQLRASPGYKQGSSARAHVFSLGPSHSATEKTLLAPRNWGRVLEVTHLEQHIRRKDRPLKGETCMVSEHRGKRRSGDQRGSQPRPCPEHCFPKCGPRIPKVPRTFQALKVRTVLMIPSPSPRRCIHQ